MTRGCIVKSHRGLGGRMIDFRPQTQHYRHGFLPRYPPHVLMSPDTYPRPWFHQSVCYNRPLLSSTIKSWYSWNIADSDDKYQQPNSSYTGIRDVPNPGYNHQEGIFSYYPPDYMKLYRNEGMDGQLGQW